MYGSIYTTWHVLNNDEISTLCRNSTQVIPTLGVDRGK